MNKKIGVFSVAASFIGFGIIMLLNNFYNFNIINAVSIMIAVILIFLGIEFIYYTSRYKDVDIRVSGKSIFTLFVICIFAFIIAGITQFFDNGNIKLSNINSFEDLFISKSVSKTYSIALEDYANLEVKNAIGDVYVEGADIDEIAINAILHYNEWSNNPTDLDTFIDFDYLGDTINVTCKSPNQAIFNVNSSSISLFIAVPKDFMSEIKNRHGEVTVADIAGPLEIDNEHGDVYVNAIKQNVTITNAHDDVNVEDINGDLLLTNRHGKTSIYNITGNIEVTGAHDPIIVDNVTGDVKLINSYDDVEVNNISGELDLEISHGDAYLSGISNATVNGNFADITFIQENLLESLFIKTDHDDVKVTVPQDDYQLSLSSQHGDIDTNLDLNINEDNTTETYEGKIGEGTSNIKIITTHGDIDLYVNDVG